MARKLYMVRWPDLSAALVYAEDEEELVYLLDAIADPSSCTWKIYKGPMYLEINLGLNAKVAFTPDIPRKPPVPPIPGATPGEAEDFDARRLDPGDITVTGEFDRNLHAELGHDATPEIVDAVREFAFPHVGKVVNEAIKRDEEPDNAALLEAAKIDFAEGQNRARDAMMKRAHSTHRLAPLARKMGTSIEALKAHGVDGSKSEEDEEN